MNKPSIKQTAVVVPLDVQNPSDIKEFSQTWTVQKDSRGGLHAAERRSQEPGASLRSRLKEEPDGGSGMPLSWLPLVVPTAKAAFPEHRRKSLNAGSSHSSRTFPWLTTPKGKKTKRSWNSSANVLVRYLSSLCTTPCVPQRCNQLWASLIIINRFLLPRGKLCPCNLDSLALRHAAQHSCNLSCTRQHFKYLKTASYHPAPAYLFKANTWSSFSCSSFDPVSSFHLSRSPLEAFLVCQQPLKTHWQQEPQGLPEMWPTCPLVQGADATLLQWLPALRSNFVTWWIEGWDFSCLDFPPAFPSLQPWTIFCSWAELTRFPNNNVRKEPQADDQVWGNFACHWPESSNHLKNDLLLCGTEA